MQEFTGLDGNWSLAPAQKELDRDDIKLIHSPLPFSEKKGGENENTDRST